MRQGLLSDLANGVIEAYDVVPEEREMFVKAVMARAPLCTGDMHTYTCEGRAHVMAVIESMGEPGDIGKMGEAVGRTLEVSFPVEVLPRNNIAMVLMTQAYEAWGEAMVGRRAAKWIAGRVAKNPKLDDVPMAIEALLGMNQLWLEMYYELTEWLVKAQIKALQSGEDRNRLAQFEDVMYRMLEKDMDTILDNVTFPEEAPEVEWMAGRFDKLSKLDSKAMMSKARDNLKRSELFEPKSFDRKIFYVWLFRGMVLRRHFQECVERAVPIAMSICDMRWERK